MSTQDRNELEARDGIVGGVLDGILNRVLAAVLAPDKIAAARDRLKLKLNQYLDELNPETLSADLMFVASGQQSSIRVGDPLFAESPSGGFEMMGVATESAGVTSAPRRRPRLFLRHARKKLVQQAMAEYGFSRSEAERAVDAYVTDDDIMAAAASKGVSEEDVQDSGFWAWIKKWGPVFLQIIGALLPLLLLFIQPSPNRKEDRHV